MYLAFPELGNRDYDARDDRVRVRVGWRRAIGAATDEMDELAASEDALFRE